MERKFSSLIRIKDFSIKKLSEVNAILRVELQSNITVRGSFSILLEAYDEKGLLKKVAVVTKLAAESGTLVAEVPISHFGSVSVFRITVFSEDDEILAVFDVHDLQSTFLRSE